MKRAREHNLLARPDELAVVPHLALEALEVPVGNLKHLLGMMKQAARYPGDSQNAYAGVFFEHPAEHAVGPPGRGAGPGQKIIGLGASDRIAIHRRAGTLKSRVADRAFRKNARLGLAQGQVVHPVAGVIQEAVGRKHQGPLGADEFINEVQQPRPHLFRRPAEQGRERPDAGMNDDHVILGRKGRLQDVGEVFFRKSRHGDDCKQPLRLVPRA